ncbi:hypothetical protein [Streptomyces acidiscabies]|uniref:hypothetical protein n=1 Tax=Streptomyces acidiscabies TaxID=42234 RepID=UPI0038F6F150
MSGEQNGRRKDAGDGEERELLTEGGQHGKAGGDGPGERVRGLLGEDAGDGEAGAWVRELPARNAGGGDTGTREPLAEGAGDSEPEEWVRELLARNAEDGDTGTREPLAEGAGGGDTEARARGPLTKDAGDSEPEEWVRELLARNAEDGDTGTREPLAEGAGGGDTEARARGPLTKDAGDGEPEEWVRELLAEDAYAISPSPVPYPAIRRRGVVERRRRLAVAGAVIVALGVAPVATWAVVRGDRADTVVAGPPAGDSSASYSSPPATPQGPTPPATAAQLVAGITFAQAADGLEKCLAYERSGVQHPGEEGLGEASEYRVILAIPSTGDSNSPGDGIYVVAVKEKPNPVRLICTLRNGRAEGINGGGADEEPGALVQPDINSGKLYQQSFIDRGNWKLPFRWGVIGTYAPAKVTRVTASYGGSTPVEATLDHGWYVATGVLDRQVTRAPHLKGYDSSGRLVYDSDTDTTYERTLP